MSLEEFINQNDVEKSLDLVSEDFVKEIEDSLSIKIGVELRNYILKFGQLSFEYVEFYGVTAELGMNSDLVTQTLYLHKYFSETKNLIAFENQGDGDYFLVDENDMILEFDSALKELRPTNQDLNEYILDRFNTALECV